MNLTFAKTYPKGHSKQYMQTYFKDRIINGQKIHSFRFGHSWENLKMIHMWSGNPRVPSHEAERFSLKHFTDKFSKDFSKQEGHIHEYCPLAFVEDFTVEFPNPRNWETSMSFLKINGHLINDEGLLTFIANNDGLTLDDFREWMYLGAIGWMKENGQRHEVKIKVQAPGRIVHWTKTRYMTTTLKESNA